MTTGSTPRRRWVGLAAVAACLAGVLGGCAIPEQEGAEPLDDVPQELLAVATTTIPSVEEAQFELVLFWHAEAGRLIKVHRQVQARPTIQDAIGQLRGGPTQDELVANPGGEFFRVDPGLTNLGETPQVSDPVDGVVTIVVAPDAGFRDLDNKRNAVAELVCTLTEFDDVTGVVIRDDQAEPIVLPDVNSSLIDGPAMRSHYADCLTPEPSTTTTG